LSFGHFFSDDVALGSHHRYDINQQHGHKKKDGNVEGNFCFQTAKKHNYP
jgi:hypothetical protein